jgi:D-alanine transaminase
MVGEGAYTNVAVVHQGQLATCTLDDAETPVLHGTMRAWTLAAAHAAGVTCVERPIHERELRTAQEVLIMSSRRLVSAVVQLDGATVGDGRAGPVCRALFAGMRERIGASLGIAVHC